MTGGYTIEVAEESEGPFTTFTQIPATRVVIDGRRPMKTYWVRSRAIGTASPLRAGFAKGRAKAARPWSTVISIIAM